MPSIATTANAHDRAGTEVSVATQIGAALKTEVIRHGRSISSLARTLALSKSSVYRRVRGETDITLNEVCAIAPHLGMEQYALLIALKPAPVAAAEEMDS